MPCMSAVNWDDVRHALDTAQSLGYRRVRLTQQGVTFQATLGAQPAPAPAPISEPEVVVAAETVKVTAPCVGYCTFAKGLEVGQNVEAGDKLAVIVALGLNNEVVAPAAGTVVALGVKDGAAVDFDTILVELS